MRQLSYAYLAGLFDASGEVRTTRTQPYLSFYLPGIELAEPLQRKISTVRFFYKVLLRETVPTLVAVLSGSTAISVAQEIVSFCCEQKLSLKSFLKHPNDSQLLLKEVSRIETTRQESTIEHRSARTKQKAICIEEGCEKSARARSRCNLHYEEHRKQLRSEGDISDLRAHRKFEYARIPTKDELEYFAGFFEGCCSVDATRCFYTYRKTDEAVALIQSIYAGSITETKKSYKDPHAIYRLSAKNSVDQFLKDVLPTLFSGQEGVNFILNEWDDYEEASRRKKREDLSKKHDLEMIKSNNLYNPISHLEKCYFAGFLDAEGSFAIDTKTKTGNHFARVNLGQTRPESIIRVYRAYGGSLLFDNKADTPKEKPQLQLQISASKSVFRIIDDVKDMLREKCEQAKMLRDTYNPMMTFIDAIKLNDQLSQLKKLEIDEETFPWGNASPKRNPRSKNEVNRCTTKGCKRKIYSRELCYKHYEEFRQGPTWVSTRIQTVPFSYESIGTPSEETKAWLAGYFDGDGNIYASQDILQVVFGQTDGRPLTFIRDIYGGSIIPYHPPEAPKRLVARYQLRQREAVFQFLKDVVPYLGEKKKLVELILSDWTIRMPPKQWKIFKVKLEEHYDFRMTEDILLDMLGPPDEALQEPCQTSVLGSSL